LLNVWLEDSMKIRTLLGLAAVGGAYYAHRKRGGELTADSVKDSLRALRDSVGDALEKLKSGPAQLDSQLSSKARPSKTYDADLIEPTGGGTGLR
jgi:hypothetical protein